MCLWERLRTTRVCIFLRTWSMNTECWLMRQSELQSLDSNAKTTFWGIAAQNVAKYYEVNPRTVRKTRSAAKKTGSPKKEKRIGRPKVYGAAALPLVLGALNHNGGRTIMQATGLLETTWSLPTTTTYKGKLRHSPSHSTIDNM